MKEEVDHLIDRMASLAEPARLRLLHLVESQSMLVNDLAEVLQLPQSTVSRHLKQLSDQGWLISKREGTSHLYRMMVDELQPAARDLWNLTKTQCADWPAIAQDRIRLASVLANRQRDSRTFFAGAARDWDHLRNEYFGARFTFDAMLALLDRKQVVADLGCGTGAVLEQLSNHLDHVIGIDNSAEMLSAARKRLGERKNVHFEQGDLTAIPLKNESVDAALCLLSLSYVSEIEKTLSEIHRILKKGGRVVIVDVLTHHRDDFRRQMGQVRLGFDLENLKKLLISQKLTPHRFAPLPPEPDTKGPALFIALATR